MTSVQLIEERTLCELLNIVMRNLNQKYAIMLVVMCLLWIKSLPLSVFLNGDWLGWHRVLPVQGLQVCLLCIKVSSPTQISWPLQILCAYNQLYPSPGWAYEVFSLRNILAELWFQKKNANTQVSPLQEQPMQWCIDNRILVHTH